MAPGPWYHDSVVFRAGGEAALVVYTMEGPVAKCDIRVSLRRQSGWGHPAIYQALGPGTWDVVYAEAAILRSRCGMARCFTLARRAASRAP